MLAGRYGQFIARMKIKIKEPYFAVELKWIVGILGIGGSFYLLTSTTYGLFSILIVLAVIVVFSTGYSLIIDTDKKLIKDDFKFLWISTESEQVDYSNLQKITISKDRHTYTANSRGKTGVTDFNEFIATLHYDNSEEIELKRSINFQAFSEYVHDLANKLQLDVEKTN